MSKEEFLKIQTCVLKVNIHCDGCKHKVKKILQKIDGVYTIKIDAEQGKVTVSGNLDPYTLIKKLAKSGKHAEIWGSQPSNNFQNQFKNMQFDQGKGGNKNQKGEVSIPQPKGGGGGCPPNLQQLQQLQQQMKGFQDQKLPQLKDMKGPFKLPPNQNQNNKKSVKFESDDDEDMTDDEFGDFDEEDDEFDEEEDDEDDESEYDMDDKHHQLNKMKPLMGNGSQGPNLMMMNGQAKQGGLGDPFGGANGKNGGGNGGGPFPVQINGIGKNGTGGKHGGGSNGTTNGGNQGQGGSAKSVGKKGGGEAKNGNGGGESINKNGHNGNGGGGPNGAKKGWDQPMNTGHQMVNMSMPMGHMPPVHGRPAATMGAGGDDGGGGVGYSHGGPLEGMGGNQYQQQIAAAMMNQQRAIGNERFQPMMYARPPPAVNYAPPPYPYPYPYQHPQPPYPPPQDSYTYYDEENTSSCNVM